MDYASQETRAQLLARDDMLSADHAAVKADRDLESLILMREGGGMIGLPAPDGSFVYPEWQFRYDGQPYFDLSNVNAALSDPWLAYEFMTTAHAELGGSTGAAWIALSREENLGPVATQWLARRPRP